MTKEGPIEEKEKSSRASANPSSSSRSASYSPSPPGSPLGNDETTSVKSRRSSSGSSQSRRRKRRNSSSSPRIRDRRDAASVELTGITRVVTESHLNHIFGQYGTIEDIFLPTSRGTGENEGRGWVIYRSSSNAEKAEEYMNGGQIDGVIISVRQSHFKEEDRHRNSYRSLGNANSGRSEGRRRGDRDYMRRYEK